MCAEGMRGNAFPEGVGNGGALIVVLAGIDTGGFLYSVDFNGGNTTPRTALCV